MLMRKLGGTGMKVAALCLGGNTFGWTTEQKASEAVLDAYMEAGGNFIDTADVYSRWAPGNKGGESEVALGIWMAARKNRHAVIMATKVCGPMGPGPNDGGLSRLHIMQAVEASLTPAADRLHRSLPGPLGRQGHAARRDAARLRRPGAPGQGALHRCLQPLGVAAHARPVGVEPRRLRALRVPAAEVQPGDPRRVRARAGAALPRAERRRHPVLLAGQRLPVGQVPARRRDAHHRPRGRRAEDLHERARLHRDGRRREGGGRRGRHARRRSRCRGSRIGRASPLRSPARPRWHS